MLSPSDTASFHSRNLSLSLSLSLFHSSCLSFYEPPSHAHTLTHTHPQTKTHFSCHSTSSRTLSLSLSLTHTLTLSPPFLAFNLSCNRSYSRIRTPVSSGLGSLNCCLRTTLASLSVQELSSTIRFIQLLHQSIFTH